MANVALSLYESQTCGKSTTERRWKSLPTCNSASISILLPCHNTDTSWDSSEYQGNIYPCPDWFDGYRIMPHRERLDKSPQRTYKASVLPTSISVHCRSYLGIVFCLFTNASRRKPKPQVLPQLTFPHGPHCCSSEAPEGKSAGVRGSWNICTIILGFLLFLCDSLLHDYMTQYAYLLTDWFHLGPNVCKDFIAYFI